MQKIQSVGKKKEQISIKTKITCDIFVTNSQIITESKFKINVLLHVFKERKKFNVHFHFNYVKTDKETMKPNIESEIQPQVQQIELRGSDLRFSEKLSIRERLIDGRVSKGSSYSILQTTNKSVKKMKLFKIIVLYRVSKPTCIQQEIFHENFV